MFGDVYSNRGSADCSAASPGGSASSPSPLLARLLVPGDDADADVVNLLALNRMLMVFRQVWSTHRPDSTWGGVSFRRQEQGFERARTLIILRW